VNSGRLWIALGGLALFSSFARATCLSTMIANGYLPNPFSLSVIAGNTQFVVPTQNGYVRNENGAIVLRPGVDAITDVLFRRTPAEQKAIDEKLKVAHGRTENSFLKTENGRKVTFIPETHGMVLPVPKSYFDTLVQSTKPILQRMRKILQGYYASENPSIESMGIQDFSPADRATLLGIMNSSMYFEPKTRHANLASYPFLFAAGFDAAIRDLDRPDATFFECNLGTPSGMSNNIQLLDNLRTVDPELFNVLKNRLPKDETFAIFRQVLEQSARAWTGVAEGISVIISPGTENAAHPDISYHAVLSGLPLVRPRDLYQDVRGFIRLDQGRGERDAIVTGIYNRMEESFLLNSPEDGVPARVTWALETNRRLSRALNLRLDDAYLYDYVYRDGQIVDVARNADGSPRLQVIWERMRRDPYRVDADVPHLLEAVKAKKVFVSNLGGRIDDKRIFALIAKYAARDAALVAHPPRTYSPEEYEAIIARGEQETLVVKEPDRSGSDGVHPLRAMGRDEQSAVLGRLRADRGHFTVQEFVSTASLLTPSINTTAQYFGPRVFDLRIYAFFDADGNVQAGTNSVLLRVAKEGSVISNTSAGGGYGIAVVVADNGTPVSADFSLPAPVHTTELALGRRDDYRDYLTSFLELRDTLAAGNVISREPGALEAFAQRQRRVMDLVPREVNSLMDDLRLYAAGSISSDELGRRLSAAQALISSATFRDPALSYLNQEYLGAGLATPGNVGEVRQQILAYLKGNGFPLMLKQTPRGEVPVLLVNSGNVAQVRKLFHHTIGFQVEHQPTHEYDHGHLRIGQTLIDRDSPGRRTVGEIRQTGISWGNVVDWVDYKHRAFINEPAVRPNVRIENAFVATPEDMDDARYYQAVRRAGVFYMQYSMDRQPFALAGANVLSTAEHCHTFAKGSTIGAQVTEIDQRIFRLADADAAALTAIPDVQNYLATVRREVKGWLVAYDPAHDQATFDPEKLVNLPIQGRPAWQFFENNYPAYFRVGSSRHLLKWLVAWDAADIYRLLMARLSISPNFGFGDELAGGKNHVVLIYDVDFNAFTKFTNATYESAGRTGAWTAEQQRSVRYGAE
jgi:uncharacterized circularly permuted ATP-grasp superfamily protein